MVTSLDKIKLTPREEMMCNAAEAQAATLGYNPKIDLLTKVLKQVSEQKFCVLPLADYFPVSVGSSGGDGAWNTELVKFTSYTVGDSSFESGVINTAENNSRLTETNVAMGNLTFPVVTWAKSVTWSLPQIEHASATGNFSLVESLERSRRMNWLLGLQKIAFLGSDKLNLPGLLTSGQFVDEDTIQTPLSQMTPEEFNTAIATIIAVYAEQVAYTVMPNRLLLPQDDYLGLVSASSPQFPIVTRLQYLEDALKAQSGHNDFKILGSPYGMPSHNNLEKARYVLYRDDSETLSLEVPVSYTSTLANTINSFQFQSVAYGRTAGMCIFRPQEILYFDAGAM